MRNFTRCLSFMLVFALLLSAFPLQSFAAANTPSVSSSCFIEYVVPGSTDQLYCDANLSQRGTSNPYKNYQSRLDAGDKIRILEIINGTVAYIRYPVGNSYRYCYVPLKILFGSSSPKEHIICKSRIPTFTVPGGSETGYVDVNDDLFLYSTVRGGEYIVGVYTAKNSSSGRGYKAAFLRVSQLDVARGTSTNSNTASKSAKVTLNVPSYKQTDSRWANVKIGTKNIGKIGCLVTSLAMVQSYKTGSAIYPDTMKGKLTFSNNDLYWSSAEALGYTHLSYKTGITNAIMAKIYEQLKAGKPVIIGAYSPSKAYSHWIVITGYTGNSTSSFDPSNFTINDPSANRTTLAQFLGVFSSVRGLVY